MAVLRLINGHDVTIKLSVGETLAALGDDGDRFVELASDDGPIHVRRNGVIAVIEEADKRGRAGFHVGDRQAPAN